METAKKTSLIEGEKCEHCAGPRDMNDLPVGLQPVSASTKRES
jgi:hypothetical protein